MTNAFFYLMASDNDLQRLKYACTLAEKSYKKGKTVFIHSANEQQSQHLDNLLWSVRDNSFIPHQLQTHEPDNNSPIVIGHQQPSSDRYQVMINLSSAPANADQFEWVLEVVNKQPSITELSRTNWRHYQQLGITPSSKNC
ncbi:DNA polymerase III subunit chi [Sinobacterium norvegicum]|uniref:DNA polymerase III subunit chi n=1 Tax=Sinobacterium norvegicum TaxID=1641715 RepID=A0ABM9AC89_9GAMM|nr:DNA polymerase III subunit chi [Sinobacterium norvegicum]CAH0990815.1 DNA polymerase III subunit chi [Sinobacterium norvegicum]